MISNIQIENGKLKELSYLIFDQNRDSVLIDPGEEFSKIIDIIDSKDLNLIAILCTHGHYDHIASVKIFQEKYNIPFHLHRNDIGLLRQANFYRTLFSGNHNILIPEVNVDLSNYSNLKFGHLYIQVLQTPGHTSGGVSFLVDKMLFSGDNIINYKIGRSDLPGGNSNDLFQSVKLMLDLTDDVIIYPGHGRSMSILDVRQSLRSIIL